MSYLVLARKWRPTTFDDVVGQEAITRTLKNAIERDRVPHALLFTGSRGVGKTSCARILAKALNCVNGPTATPCGECPACVEISGGTSVDVFEIDGASNNGVEQIREIRDSVKFLPTRGKRKMYIIDEVHMLSTGAFNALLKTLEEPPDHVLFIFATTEPHKIPDTILSRCQRFDFKRIPERKIAGALGRIAEAEGISIEAAGLHHIAREAQGGMRDSLSLLDQVISFCGTEIKEDELRQVLGIADRGVLHSLSQALLDGDGQQALEIVEDLFQFGIDLQKFASDLVQHMRDLMVIRICEDAGRLVDQPDSEVDHMRALLAEIEPARIHRLFNALLQGADEMGRSPFPRLVLEMTLLRICHQGPTMPLADVLKGLERLEARLDDGDDDPDGGPSGPAGGSGGSGRGGSGRGDSGGGPRGHSGGASQSHQGASAQAASVASAPSTSSPSASALPAPTSSEPATAPEAKSESVVPAESSGGARDALNALAELTGGGPIKPAAPQSQPNHQGANGHSRPAPAPRHDPALEDSIAAIAQAAEQASEARAQHEAANPVPAEEADPPERTDAGPPAHVVDGPPREAQRPVAEAPPAAVETPAELSDPAYETEDDDPWPGPNDAEAWDPPDDEGPDLATAPEWKTQQVSIKASGGEEAEISDATMSREEALAALGVKVNGQGKVRKLVVLPPPELEDDIVGPRVIDPEVRPVNLSEADGAVARFARVAAELHKRDGFLAARLSTFAHPLAVEPHALELALPNEEHGAVSDQVHKISDLWAEAVGGEVAITLHDCEPGDARLTGETVTDWRARLRAEAEAARKASAESDPRVQAVISLLGGEIIQIHPRDIAS